MDSLQLWSFVDDMRERIGHPDALTRMHSAYPDIHVDIRGPKPCIALNSVTSWHDLGTDTNWPSRERGDLLGWRARSDGYSSFRMMRFEYQAISRCTVTEGWTCDITDVHGFSASKSDLRQFAHTDQMVETKAQRMINEITEDMLRENLAHNEIRILHNRGGDHLARFLWDGRLFLVNSGGSHHFAAAKYIAARLRLPVPITGRFKEYSLNSSAIDSLRRDFEMFMLPAKPAELTNSFHDAMEKLRATWLWHHLPWPLSDTRAILLPRAQLRSMRVAMKLRRAGATDLGAFLSHLALRQRDTRSTDQIASLSPT